MSLPTEMARFCDAPQSFASTLQPAQSSLSVGADSLSPPPPPPPSPLHEDEQQPCRPCPWGELPALVVLRLSLLQVFLASALVALSFTTMWYSSLEPMKNAWSTLAGSMVILCGILGLMGWKKSTVILNKLFIVLSAICIPLSLTGLVLGYQGIELVSRLSRCNLMDKENKICFCCEDLDLTKCAEGGMVLKLYHVKSCSSTHLLLKKVLLGICVLNALITTVCLTAVVMHFCLVFSSRRSCLSELQTEEQDHILNPDGCIPLEPPPSYFATYYSSSLQMTRRALAFEECSLPHVYARQISGAEVFFCVEPPPAYEDVRNLNISEQGGALQTSVMKCVDSREDSEGQDSQGSCPGGHVIKSPCYPSDGVPESCDDLTTSTMVEDQLAESRV